MKWTKQGRVLTLGHTDTKKWNDEGYTGRSFRAQVQELASDHAKHLKDFVEVYAAAKHGGARLLRVDPTPPNAEYGLGYNQPVRR